MADNRKYYYLKLKESFFDGDSIVLLESMPDGILFSNILMKLYLKSLKNGGKLQLDEHIPYTAQMIATLTRHQIGTVERAIKVFLQLGLVEQLDGGLLYMTDIELMIGQSSTEGERKRAARRENRALLPQRTNVGHKPEVESLQKACGSQMAVVKAVERKDKAEKPPALYDLTTLQRDANRILGFTAQQTLDYLQSLYEKKLCTYPRTDSRYLTSDMADGLPALVSNVAATMPKVGGITIHVNAAQVINDKKVSDHHAVIPTANLNENALAGLPAGERAVLELVALRLLCAVSQPHEYTETAVTLECAGHSFSAKGRTVMNPGWRALMEAHYSGKGENETSDAAKALPPVDERQTFTVHSAAVKEGKTTPPKHYTEDTLLSAMEVAGAKEMPEDAERKGLGTPATRAAILEKLVATGFVERKKSKKTVSLIPTHAGISLITVLPEQLQSPLMTAEWEHRLKEIERGEEAPETFMQGIRDMVCELVKTYKTVLGADVLFPSGRAVVGKCPRCGSDVTESKKGYFCERNDCHFGLWRDNRFLAAKKINLTKKMAETLLKDGKTYASGIFSEKTGKTYDAYIALEDDGTKTAYRLEFERGKANGKQYL